MFIPLFIAILLGLVNPSHTNTSGCGNTTVNVSSADDPDQDPDPDSDPDDSNTDTGGEQGHVPPRKP